MDDVGQVIDAHCRSRAADDLTKGGSWRRRITPMRLFNPKATRPARAVQAWQILLGKAMNYQRVNYEILGKLMFQGKAEGVLDRILGHVAFYCLDNDLPPLTCIVVNKRTGRSGADIPH